MRIRSWSLGMTLALLTCLLVAPSPAEAQCPIASTMVSMAGANTTGVYKVLSSPQYCGLTMSNASFCYPGIMSPMTVTTLFATAMTATMSPSCNWNCGMCGSVSIDGSDGLPVELLDFSIEEDEVEEDPVEAEEDDAGDERAPE